MSLFYAVAAVLTALAGVLLTVPRWHRRRWQGESNLDWLMLRQRELSGEGEAAGEALSLDAELRILDEADESAPTPAAAADRNPEQRDWRVLGPVLFLLLVMPRQPAERESAFVRDRGPRRRGPRRCRRGTAVKIVKIS